MISKRISNRWRRQEMKTGKLYSINHKEYLVLDGTSDLMPDHDGRQLLSNRSRGVGADYFMVFTGTDREPSFLLYGADGAAVQPGHEAYRVLARYLHDHQEVPNASEMVKHLGEQAFLAGSEREISCVEVRITEYFWQLVLSAGGREITREIA